MNFLKDFDSNLQKRTFSEVGGHGPRVIKKTESTSMQQNLSVTSDYFYDRGRATGGKLGHQVKYGPGSAFSPSERGILHAHYGTKAVTSRYTQYNSDRQTYVNSAINNGRGMTLQESEINNNRDPGQTSINHIIASGTGQQALNRTTLEYLSGRKTATDQNLSQKQRFSGIAQQAAAMGRMRGLGREILREEIKAEGYGRSLNSYGMSEQQAFIQKRNLMAKDIHNAFEAGDVNSYKRFMKNTFDSTGNLRLGHGSGNSRVSTGFDMPLTPSLKPTQRGNRLLATYKTFGYEDMQKEGSLGKRNNSGIFTSNLVGSKLSSSRQKSNDVVDRRRRFLG